MEPLCLCGKMLKGKRHYGKEGGGEAGGADEIWLAVSMRMSHSSSSLDLELRAYSGLRWHVYVCMYVVVCARMHAHKCSHGPIQQLKSPNFRCWLSHCACVCVCVCWRKMKVVWRANHNIEARFKRRYLSSFSPALKSPLLHYHSVYHPSSIVASIASDNL